MMKILLLFVSLLIPPVFVNAQKASEGKAIVYVYSLATTTTIGRIRKPVFLDAAEIAEIRPEHYFIALVDPGKHSIHLKNKKFGGIEKEFAAGSTYYIRMEWRNNGIAVVPQNITLVSTESGEFDIKQIKPVDKDNIKDAKIVVLKLD